MDIKRFFVKESDIDGDFAYIRDEEFFHATKVLRQKVGYTIILCSGDGYDLVCTILEISKNFIKAKINERIKNFTENKTNIVLLSSIVKESDFIVQKAVELGVNEFIPLRTRFVNAKFDIDRSKRIALQSIKQCERAKLMTIKDEMTFSEGLRYVANFDLKILPYENATSGKISNIVKGGEKNVALLIGPEGGFAEEEVRLALDSGFSIVTLGTRILRAETATISALALTLDALGEI